MPNNNSAVAANNPVVEAPYVGASGFEVQQNPGGLANWFTQEDPVAHNEAFYAWQREEASAQAAREDAWRQKYFDASREDTQFQRKLADYTAAGFSPLSALEGSGNYAGSSAYQSAQAHSESSHPRQSGNPATLISSIIGAIALVASKGMSASAQAAQTAVRTEAARDIAQQRIEANLLAAEGKTQAAKDIVKNKIEASLAAASGNNQARIDVARIHAFNDDIRKVGDSIRIGKNSAKAAKELDDVMSQTEGMSLEEFRRKFKQYPYDD